MNKICVKQKLLVIAALHSCRNPQSFSSQTENYVKEISESLGIKPLIISYYPGQWDKIPQLLLSHNEPYDTNLPGYTVVTWQLEGKRGFEITAL